MMFALFGYRNGYFVLCAIICLVLCCFQSASANKEINRINEENAHNIYKQNLPTAPFVSLIFSIFILVLALVLPMKE